MTDQTPPSPLPTTDTPASRADRTVQDILRDLVPVLENLAIAAQPVLGAPILRQVWQTFFEWLMGLAGGALGLVAGYVVMDVQKAQALAAAGQALANLNKAKQSGDQDAINAADQAADDAAADVLHYVGSVQPH